MQKRLRYAMPRIPLHKHRQEEGLENENMRGNVAAMTNVGVMARRIGEAERKKRRAYRAPLERPLGGDVESSSDSD